MIKLVKYIMKVFYANENYAKYGVPGMNYFMALMGATFYIILTLFLVLFVFLAAFPALNRFYLTWSPKFPSIPSGLITIGLLFFLLRFFTKEENLKDSSFTKERVNKAVNILLAYAFFIMLIIGFIGLKFLR